MFLAISARDITFKFNMNHAVLTVLSAYFENRKKDKLGTYIYSRKVEIIYVICVKTKSRDYQNVYAILYARGTSGFCS